MKMKNNDIEFPDWCEAEVVRAILKAIDDFKENSDDDESYIEDLIVSKN